MKKGLFVWLLSLLVLAACAERVAGQECSTEKVNADCTVTIDRSYPVTMPTIQMRRDAKVTVIVVKSLPFEALSLDPQSAQAVAGTDQTAGLVTAAIPYAKGLQTSAKVDLLGPALDTQYLFRTAAIE